MWCLKCRCGTFVTKKIVLSPEIKGEKVDVSVPAFICSYCSTPLMTDGQMNLFRQVAADKYREQHGLLTSCQIVQHREDLGMTQEHFAKLLHVDKKTVQHWETYYVQDPSQDSLIREKCG